MPRRRASARSTGALRAAPLQDGDDGGDERERERGREGADDDPAAPRPHGAIPIGPRPAGLEEASLVVGDLEVRLIDPRLRQLESAAAVQEAGIGPGADPLVCRCLESPAGEQLLTGVVDPSGEPIPLGQQRLVGDLDGGGPTHRVPVEREEAVASELVEDRLQVVGADARSLELRPAHPAACVVVVLADAHQPQEHAAGGAASLVVEPVVDRLGTPTDGTDETAGANVGLEGDGVAIAPGEQLGHRVLHQRQGARLRCCLLGDALDERGVDLDADCGGRKSDGVGQLARRHRADGDGASLDRLVEAGMAERAIEVVGAQRRHDAHVSRLAAPEAHEQVQEGAPLAVVHRLGEQLLELVDDEEELGARRQDLAGHVVERSSSMRPTRRRCPEA